MLFYFATDFVDWLREQGREDLASQIDHDWCWKGIGAWARDNNLLQTDLHEKFVADLVCDGRPSMLLKYLEDVEHNDVMLQALIAMRAPSWLHAYLRHVGHRDDVLQALIECGEGWHFFWYLNDTGHRDDVLQALVATGNANYLCEWLCSHHHRDDVFQALVASGNSRLLRRYYAVRPLDEVAAAIAELEDSA